MKIFLLAIFCFLSLSSPASENCQPLLLRNYKRKIASLSDALQVFKDYYKDEVKYGVFRPSQVKVDRSPQCLGDGSADSKTCYFYYDWYGFGPKGVGAYLYGDGRLMQFQYCK